MFKYEIHHEYFIYNKIHKLAKQIKIKTIIKKIKGKENRQENLKII